ncbi:MAG: protein-L-isoaspartate(D-aspartate) O-methyltransferase [bacterium]|nr:protein-L-isoaspartate(D-aspartate) O-methyltransferase [bacterium]
MNKDVYIRKMPNDSMEYTRRGMVEDLARKGVYSSTVLDAIFALPRQLFVSEALRYRAYDDTSLPIGFGQTISKPSVIAKMVQALGLTGTERVLEIGTGSGYQTALLASLCKSLVSMERIEALYLRARNVLLSLNYPNITLLHNDDFNETEGAFDAIIVAAGAEILPMDIFAKLNTGGVLVIPVGSSTGHLIKRFIKKNDDTFIEEDIGEALFVPYIVGESA